MGISNENECFDHGTKESLIYTNLADVADCLKLFILLSQKDLSAFAPGHVLMTYS